MPPWQCPNPRCSTKYDRRGGLLRHLNKAHGLTLEMETLNQLCGTPYRIKQSKTASASPSLKKQPKVKDRHRDKGPAIRQPAAVQPAENTIEVIDIRTPSPPPFLMNARLPMPHASVLSPDTTPEPIPPLTPLTPPDIAGFAAQRFDVNGASGMEKGKGREIPLTPPSSLSTPSRFPTWVTSSPPPTPSPSRRSPLSSLPRLSDPYRSLPPTHDIEAILPGTPVPGYEGNEGDDELSVGDDDDDEPMPPLTDKPNKTSMWKGKQRALEVDALPLSRSTAVKYGRPALSAHDPAFTRELSSASSAAESTTADEMQVEANMEVSDLDAFDLHPAIGV